MQPRTIEKLDPFYANEQGYIEFAAKTQLHKATILLNEIAERQGDPVPAHLLSPKIFGMLCVGDPFSIGNPEAFFAAKLLPSHDTFITPRGETISSRFLVVDVRHPTDEDPDEPNPDHRIRAYFVVFGEELPREAANILPYYVVSDREITAAGESNEELHHQRSTVFYSPKDAWPLHDGGKPLHVREPEPYAALATEMELAVSCLASGHTQPHP